MATGRRKKKNTKTHSKGQTPKSQRRGARKSGKRGDEFKPASHEDGLVCTKLLPVHQDCDIGEDVSAPQPVQVEQDVARVARELYAAVCCASHFLKICKKQDKHTWQH